VEARCACGAIGIATDASAIFIILCHCLECQRRTGAPFGAGVYYPGPDIRISGDPGEYARGTESGGTMRNRFCARCGSTVWWTIDAHPELVGVALGTFATPVPNVPVHSLWERSRCSWVAFEGVTERHPLGFPQA